MKNTLDAYGPKTILPELDDFPSYLKLSNHLSVGRTKPMLIDSEGNQIDIPEEVIDILKQVTFALRNGLGVTIVPIDTKLTTQEAADFLRISRPTLVSLLEDGAIPFGRVGRHRRVTLEDLLEYQERIREERRVRLNLLAQAGQESETYFDAESFSRLEE